MARNARFMSWAPWVVGFFLGLLVLPVTALAADAKKPNVLFIAVDDLNHWVGYLGRNPQTRTPNIDRLAAQGVRFTRSYCAAPVCNGSRAALMSGLRPSTTGAYSNNNDWRTVVPAEQSLTTAFRNAGYYTAAAGKIYHGSYDRHSEWHDYMKNEGGEAKPKGNDGVGGIKFAPLDCEDSDLSDYRIVDYTIKKINAANNDKPFFLCCGLHKPHMPWNVPKKYFDMFPLEKIELPPHAPKDLEDIPPAGVKMAKPEGDHATMLKSGRWKEAVQAYLATIAYCDMNVGRLLDALDKSAHKNNTIVVFWGDHGWHLGEKEHWRKFALWEESTRSPLIWVVPGLTKANMVCERTVDFMSIYPTLAELCGLPAPPQKLEGVSIRSLLADPKANWDSPAVTTFMKGNHAVRSEAWRYIRYANGDEELYDETNDPLEWKNVAAAPENLARKNELARFLPSVNKPEILGGSKDGNEPEKSEKKKKKAK